MIWRGRALWAALLALPMSAAAQDCAPLAAQRVDYTAITPLTAGAECREVLTLSEGRQLHCHWPHTYRAASAQAQFDALVALTTDCLGAGALEPQDLAVNHPDFYDLRQFSDAAGGVSISLKDKGALQQTYVFMRFSPPSTH